MQRFGGALNLNVHFHTLFMDGIFFENEEGKQVFKEIIPTDLDVKELIHKIKKRIDRAFQKRNFLEEESEVILQLSLLKSESVQNKVDAVNKPKPIGKWCDPPFEEFAGRRCVFLDGFSLHANVKIRANQRSSLERLCRYISRGPLSKERISLTNNGNVQLKLKTPYRDGTTHLEFTPDQFIKRVIAIITPPRANLIRYYGVFGARHSKRQEITSKAKPKKENRKQKKSYRTPWAELLKRVFKYEVSNCDHCGTKLTLISTITDPGISQKILNHLKLDSNFSDAQSPRPPPELLEKQDQYKSTYNQEYSW